MLATAASISLDVAIPRLRAVVMTPVPKALLSMSLSPGFAPDLRIIAVDGNLAGHRQPVFGFGIADGVPTGDYRPCFPHFFRAASQYFCKDIKTEVVRVRDKIDGQQGPAAHSVDIAQRVCRGNGAEFIGRVNDRREKISCRNDGTTIVQLINSRVIRLRQPHQDLWKFTW